MRFENRMNQPTTPKTIDSKIPKNILNNLERNFHILIEQKRQREKIKKKQT